MKRINHYLYLLLFFAGLFLVSCNKDNVDVVVPDDPDYKPDTVLVNNLFNAVAPGTDALAMDCIQIPFPESRG